jgi:hypothetical protein
MDEPINLLLSSLNLLGVNHAGMRSVIKFWWGNLKERNC